MDIDEMIKEIKTDLGSDVSSLAITNDTIMIKIEEAVRKVSSYTPQSIVGTFNVSNGVVTMPDETIVVSQVLTDDISKTSARRDSPLYDETDLFNATRYIYNYSGSLSDPYIYMMNISEMRTLQSMVSLKDWHFDKRSHKLFLNGYSASKVTVRFLQKYEDVEDIEDIDVIQTVKEYALALCKIVEGNIRRKLQNFPGVSSMDGDSLVSEGISEKQRLDETIPRQYSYLRYGMKA